MIRGIQALIDVTRPATNALALRGQVFGLIALPTSGTATKLGGVANGTVDVGDAAQTAANQYQDFISAVNQTAATADTAAQAMTDKLLNTMLSLDQATLGSAEAQTRLQESLKQNGKQFDIHTAKGQANREAVLGNIRAYQQEYDALIASGAGAEQAAAAYKHNEQALEATLKKAGVAQSTIDDLTASYRDVPGKVNTDIAINGLTKAINDLRSTLALIAGLHDKEITLTTNRVVIDHGTVYRGSDGARLTGSSRYAGGGNAALPWGDFAPSNYAASYFAQTPGGGSFLGPATPINNDVSVTVYVDGQELRSMARVEAAQLDNRNNWRARAGRR